MVRLETINPDNWRFGLKVRDDQSKFGATSYETTSKISNDMRLHPPTISHDMSVIHYVKHYETPMQKLKEIITFIKQTKHNSRKNELCFYFFTYSFFQRAHLCRLG